MSTSTRSRLRCLLRSHLYAVLAELDEADFQRVRHLRVKEGGLAAEIAVGPVGEVMSTAAGTGHVGNWFSPIEAAIVMACTPAPLQGKEIAQKVGRALDTPLWTILKNLVERGVLEKVAGEGYQVAQPVLKSAT